MARKTTRANSAHKTAAIENGRAGRRKRGSAGQFKALNNQAWDTASPLADDEGSLQGHPLDRVVPGVLFDGDSGHEPAVSFPEGANCLLASV